MFYLDFVYLYIGNCQRVDRAERDRVRQGQGGVECDRMVKRSAEVPSPWSFIWPQNVAMCCDFIHLSVLSSSRYFWTGLGIEVLGCMSPSSILRSSQPDREDRQENWKPQTMPCVLFLMEPPFAGSVIQDRLTSFLLSWNCRRGLFPWHRRQAGRAWAQLCCSALEALHSQWDLCLGLFCIRAFKKGSWTEYVNSGQRVMEEKYVRFSPQRHPVIPGVEESTGAVLVTGPHILTSWSPVKAGHPGDVSTERAHQPWHVPTPSTTHAYPEIWGILSLHSQQRVKTLKPHLFLSLAIAAAAPSQSGVQRRAL